MAPVEADLLRLFRPNQQHHRAAHFVAHAGKRKRLGRGAGFFQRGDRKSARQKPARDLRQRVVFLNNALPEETRRARARVKIIVDRPVQRFLIRAVNPILVDAGRKHRMFEIQQENTARFQRGINVSINGVKIGHVMKREIGNHAVVRFRLIIERFDCRNLIRDVRAGVFPPRGFPFFRFPEAPVFFAQSTQKQKSGTLSA